VADLGFEHLFYRPWGILAPAVATNPFDNSDHPIEKTFRSWIAWKRIARYMPERRARTSNI